MELGEMLAAAIKANSRGEGCLPCGELEDMTVVGSFDANAAAEAFLKAVREAEEVRTVDFDRRLEQMARDFEVAAAENARRAVEIHRSIVERRAAIRSADRPLKPFRL